MLGRYDGGLGYDWASLVDKITGAAITTTVGRQQTAAELAKIKAQAAADRAANAGYGGAPAAGGVNMNTMLMVGGGVAVVGLVLFLVLKKR